MWHIVALITLRSNSSWPYFQYHTIFLRHKFIAFRWVLCTALTITLTIQSDVNLYQEHHVMNREKYKHVAKR